MGSHHPRSGGCQQTGAGVPGLLLGDGASSIHDARHLGSFGIAVSIGLLYVAWRPARTFGILPIVTALAVTMLVNATFDIVNGRVSTFGEAHHVLEFSGLVLVWMLAGRPAPRRLKPLMDLSHPPTDYATSNRLEDNIMIPHRILGAAAIFLAGLAVASPAWAQVDPDPTDAQAGSDVSVGFTVEHGCDGSPTVQLDMRLPDGISDPLAEPPSGWTRRVEDNVVTFEGGPLPGDQELTFRVRMILPAVPDTTIYFPFVQRCEVGEIRWIDIPTDGSGEELDEPAPAMRLFGPTATTPPATTTPLATTTSIEPTTARPTTTMLQTATMQPTTMGVTPATVTPATTPTIDGSPSDLPPGAAGEVGDGGSGGLLALVLAIAGIACIAGIVTIQSRRSRR